MGVGCWYPCFRIAWKMTEKYKLFLTFIWCIGWPISFNNRTTVLLIFLCKVTTLRQVYLWSSVDHFHDISLTFHERSCLGKGTDVRPPWSLDLEHEPCEQRKSREPGWRIQWHLGWRWKLRFQTQGPDNPWRHKDQRTRRGSIMIPPLVTMWLVCEWDSFSWPNPSLPAITAKHHSTWIPLWFSNQFSLLRPDRLEKSDNLGPPAFEFASYVNTDLVISCTALNL